MSKKNRHKKSKNHKIGAPPGTVIYSGEEQTGRVKITLIEYNETEFVEKDFYDLSECLQSIDSKLVRWMNVDGVHKTELIEAIGKQFNIHPLTLEDIVNTNQRAKFEDYDNYVVAMMKMIDYANEELRSEQLSVVLLNGVVISFQEPNGGDAFDLIRTRIRQGKGRIRKMGADYLAYALIDAVVDCYFTILEKIGDKIEVLEDGLITDPDKTTVEQLHNMKREMIFVRKAVWPMRELISNMQRCENELIKESTDIYLRDVHDHAIRVIDTIETYRDLLSGMMDVYLSSVSNKMNEVMKILTIITTIFVPVTFIAGVYGMNFDYMPELHSKWGYPAVWFVMLLIIALLVTYFKRKKWL
ncbi:MAG TPA: magnesium/cobalt transporter CorA [Bacteroidia bacterium]|jgi:magnesium transporter|nr:magnesium/cobalt transporter CorA [Bacteroidia bacterium]HRG52349.1 magnesium/cobalt transporter CorA [Bacteroidia bacterium]